MKRQRVVSGWGAFLGAAVVCVLGSASEAARNDQGGSPRLMQGPMIGPVSESEIVVWGRVSGPYPFNVLISGSGWNSQKLYTNRDSWSALLHERDVLFDYIRDEAIRGVVLLSGDEHIAHVMAAPWSERGGYDFYEFVSLPLAQETDNYVRYLVPEKYIREPWGGSPNFGLLTFDTRGEDATLTFDLINVYGTRVYPTLQLRASELVNGVKTWPQKMRQGRGGDPGGAGGDV